MNPEDKYNSNHYLFSGFLHDLTHQIHYLGSDLYLLESFLDNYKLKDKFKDRLRKVVIHADIIRIYLQDFGKTREFSDKDLNNAFYHNLTKELTTLSYLIILLEKEIKKENNAELNTILANIINSGQEIFDTVDFIVRGTAKQSEIKILNLTRIITSTVSVLHRTFANNKVLIETNYQDVSIKGKEGDLLHVFYCVLINSIQAFRFLPHRERKIEINLFKRKHQIVISFKDNGPGISPENLSNIFNAGFSTRQDHPGMGLAAAKLVIEKEFNGKIAIESELGKFTNVEIILN